MERRDFLATLGATGLAAAVSDVHAAQSPSSRRGRVRQSLMRNNFGPSSGLSLDEMCRTAADLGCVGFDLVGPPEWPTLKKYGLVPTMALPTGVTIQDGLIRPELHDRIEREMGDAIDLCAANAVPNMITVGGRKRAVGVYPKAAKQLGVRFGRKAAKRA